MYNQSSSSLTVLFTDVCQNVLSYISDIATYFRLPVVCTLKKTIIIRFLFIYLDIIY